MSYRVYSGPKGAATISPLEKQRMLFKEVISLDEALSFARHLSKLAPCRCSSRATTERA